MVFFLNKIKMAYEIQYRLLTDTEKELFYKDFINFLAVHGIPGEEWERIKKEDKHRMMLMFAQFSDLVIHKSLTNIKYAYKMEEHTVVLMKFDETSFDIISVNHKGDFTIENMEEELKALAEKPESMRLSYPEKGREKYIFQLTSLDGYQPCDKTYWESL